MVKNVGLKINCFMDKKWHYWAFIIPEEDLYKVMVF